MKTPSSEHQAFLSRCGAPARLAGQAAGPAVALRDLLALVAQPTALSVLAAAFEGKVTPKRKADIQRLLETMAALGQAEETEGGYWK